MQRYVDQISHGRIAKCALDGLSRVIQTAMQRAEIDAVQTEWTFVKTPNRVDCVEHAEHRDFMAGKASVNPPRMPR